VIIPKSKSVALSQWIFWNYIKGKHDRIFDEVVAACKAKHLRDIMAFRKNWNSEIIAHFFATMYVEERGDTRKIHCISDGRWYEITYEQFGRLFGFRREDANRNKIHFVLILM
jgi:hypothetical protein